MQLDVREAIYLYKELFSIPGKKSYQIENAMSGLEKYIESQLEEIEPPKTESKPSTTKPDDEIPF